MREARKDAPRPDLDCRLKVEFHGTKVASGGGILACSRYVVFQMAEVVAPRRLFRQILERISRLRASPELVRAG